MSTYNINNNFNNNWYVYGSIIIMFIALFFTAILEDSAYRNYAIVALIVTLLNILVVSFVVDDDK